MSKTFLITILLLYFAHSQTRQRQWCEGNQRAGYFWDGQHCEYCNYDCHCNEFKRCNSCQSGYSIYSQDSLKGSYCESCSFTGINSCCFEVNNKGIRATSCTASYQLYGSVCKTISNCRSYYDYGHCAACEIGYYLSSSQTCEQCQSDSDGVGEKRCKECGGPRSCRECKEGYYLMEYAGPEGIVEPASLLNPSWCEPCKTKAGGSNTDCYCTKSDKQCQRCNKTDFYYQEDEKTCIRCSISYCAECNTLVKAGDAISCKRCSAGAVLYTETSIGKCMQCPQGCTDCTYSDKKKSTSCNLDKCQNEFYYKPPDTAEGDASCVRCDSIKDSILRCDSVTKITQCKQDRPLLFNFQPQPEAYYLVENNKGVLDCRINQYNCQRMIPQASEELLTRCQSCYPGWVLVDTKVCKKCDLAACNECQKVGSSENLNCIQCRGASSKQSYQQDGEVNYYLNNGQCSQCSEGCLACNTNQDCRQCQPGYQLKDKGCLKCSTENCKVCNAGFDVCEQCWEQYQRYQDTDKSYKCQRCENNCARCDGNRKSCDQCVSGYYNSGGQCYNTRTKCINHSGDGNCLNCEYGYRVVDGRCRQCHNDSSTPAYINCQSGCSGQRYMRDGQTLTKEFNDKKNQGGDTPKNAFLLYLNLIALLLAFVSLF